MVTTPSMRNHVPADTQKEFDERSLVRHNSPGTSAFTSGPGETDTVFQLRYASSHGVLFRKICRCSGSALFTSDATALAGHYLVELLHHDAIFMVPEIFVPAGVPYGPLAGSAKLEPVDRVSVTSAPLLHGSMGSSNTRVPLLHLCPSPTPPFEPRTASHTTPTSRSRRA